MSVSQKVKLVIVIFSLLKNQLVSFEIGRWRVSIKIAMHQKVSVESITESVKQRRPADENSEGTYFPFMFIYGF